MKIPIDIRVQSERLCNDLAHMGFKEPIPQKDDYLVSGFMRKTRDGFRIEFREKEDGATTTIDTFADDTVALNRGGQLHSHMVFADGKTHVCICDTEYMPIQMRIKTKKLANTLSMQGGKLDIDYTVEIVGNLAETNRLRFSVSPDKSIIRS
ncbi:MAG: DUF1934 domain-containing protein [Clostridia bacterium]|nr:DUF1934 domain-containing protein [Clostridia bacterium]